jgi:hypothetical protein
VFFWSRPASNRNNQLTEKIKKELYTTLAKKGVEIDVIKVDLKEDSMNVKVCINREYNLV